MQLHAWRERVARWCTHGDVDDSVDNQIRAGSSSRRCGGAGGDASQVAAAPCPHHALGGRAGRHGAQHAARRWRAVGAELCGRGGGHGGERGVELERHHNYATVLPAHVSQWHSAAAGYLRFYKV